MTERVLTELVAIKSFPWHSGAFKVGDPIRVEDRVARMFVKGKLAVTPEEAKKRGIKTPENLKSGVKTPENIRGKVVTPENTKDKMKTPENAGTQRGTLGRHGGPDSEPYNRRDMHAEGTKDKSEG